MNNPLRPEEPPAESGAEVAPPPLTPSPVSTAPTIAFAVTPRANRDLLGEFGKYTIRRPIGKGGMGRVYLAHDSHLDREVALKVPELEAGDREMVRERFYREARAAANLRHPNVCPVYEVGEIDGVPYLTMAYIEGSVLHEWVRGTTPTREARVRLVQVIAAALAEAHARGVIHRDLKPSNIMIDRRGQPIIMDFGLARRLDLPEEARLTSPGLLLGTPAYMPPEHVTGQAEPGPAGDVYSLGIVLYEMLAGRGPFEGPALAILAQVISEDPQPPSRWRSDIEARFDEVCLHAIARKPENRYAGMAAFGEAIGAALEAPASRPVTPKRPLDQRIAARILEMLRTLGWARATQKMRVRMQRAETDAERAVYQAFLDYLGGDGDGARDPFEAMPEGRALRGWALVGLASHQLRDRAYVGSHKSLDRAESSGDPDDVALRASIAHTRASALVHMGRSDEALPHLHRALDLFGRTHFMTGRVLDTLGMAYAYKGNFPVAREFYEQSIRFKKTCDDEAGIAISHGQLGRLYLDWGHLDQAEEHFREDLRLAQKLRSRYSEAQICNHLGQVATARGERQAATGKRAAARRHFADAAGWLDQAIRMAQENRFGVAEAFARKDRAMLYLHEGDLEAADQQSRQAMELFRVGQFYEGIAKIHMVEGLLLRHRRKWQESERKFRDALGHFESTRENDSAVRALWEIARTLRDGDAAPPMVTRAYLDALARAEACRHDLLVRGIEQDLHEVDVETYLRHVFARVRGAGVDDDSPSLDEGVREVATVLAIDLPGFEEFSSKLDPESVLVTFNHLLGDFTDVLERHQARVLAYRGAGLFAIVRDSRHAERGVRAALALIGAVEEFNPPRGLLDLPIFQVRIGIASGDVLLGNVGTYHKMDFTAIGSTVTLAAALRNEATPQVPSISRSTRELVREMFAYQPTSPREIHFIGLGPVPVWDVAR